MKLKGLGGMLVRYVGAAVGVGVCLLVLSIVSFFQLAASCYRPENVAEYRVRAISQGIRRDTDGTFIVSSEARQALDERYVWAMQLDDTGKVIWEDRLPEALPRQYTVPEVAAFSRWYLGDYPVYCWRNDMGLIVIASDPGSEWKYDITMRSSTIEAITSWLPALLVLNLIAVFLLALLLGWRMYSAVSPVAQGLDDLAQGGTVELPERGVLKLLYTNLNRASDKLLAQRTALQKRDRTRTEWIAGVSHDIRTPLSLVQGNAAQLEAEESLPEGARKKATLIRLQSQRIGRLVSDLNLASKLEYELQPLSKKEFRPAAMLRAVVVDALNSYAEERACINVDIPPGVSTLKATGDEALIRRAVDNLLRNSIMHNEGMVDISLTLNAETDIWRVSVSDNGTGIPEERLRMLTKNSLDSLPAHGLGLVLVRQIARAHGGTAVFRNTSPGFRVILSFPI